MTPGIFLSLDGIDGTGKTTQLRLLADHLRSSGRDVVTCVDPGGTPLGQEVRHILLSGKHALADSCEALLFMASRAQLVHEVIRPALDAGKLVLSDRYVLATLAYQGHGGKLPLDHLRAVAELSTGGVMPDHVFVLDLPLDASEARRGRAADRMESKARDYRERVRLGFLAEAARDPCRISVMDASGDIDAVQRPLRSAVEQFLSRR